MTERRHEPARHPPAQGVARIVADLPPADRRRAVPVRRPDLAPPREVPCRRSTAAGGDHWETWSIPAPVPADARRAALEEPGPVRGVRRAIILAMGAVAHREGPRAPRRSCCRRRRRGRLPLASKAVRHRARARHRHDPGGRGGLDLHGDPVRADAGRADGSRWPSSPGSGWRSGRH